MNRYSPMTLLALFAASPALADWQYTKWGMTEDEVVAASSGKASAYQGDPDDLRLVGARLHAPHNAAGFDATAVFKFSEEGLLEAVSVVLSDDDCIFIQDFLQRRYGFQYVHEESPEEAMGENGSGTRDTYLQWLDAENGNYVEFLRGIHIDPTHALGERVTSTCDITYTPSLTSASGL